MKTKSMIIFLALALLVQNLLAQETTHIATPRVVKGIYVTLETFQEQKLLDGIIDLCRRTNINTLVIDVRSNGVNAFVIKNEKARKKIEILHEMGLYLVARMIVFWRPDGWFDPASERRREEVVRASKLAISLGFDEVNYDYIRYGGPHEPQSSTPIEQRTLIIRDFCVYLRKEVGDKTGKPISADFFGVTFLKSEPGVGQRVEDAINNFEYVMPMSYPSHWSAGTFGVENPGKAPYEMVFKSLTIGWKKFVDDPKRIAQLRPWLQAFGVESIYPLRLMSYTAKDVEEQIRACYDAGCVGWVLWNPSSMYERYEQVLK
jgi:hypothetical protein